MFEQSLPTLEPRHAEEGEHPVQEPVNEPHDPESLVESPVSQESLKGPAPAFSRTAAMDGAAYAAYLRMGHFVKESDRLADMAKETFAKLEEAGYGEHIRSILRECGVVNFGSEPTELGKMFASEPDRLRKIVALALADLSEVGESLSLRALMQHNGIMVQAEGFDQPTTSPL